MVEVLILKKTKSYMKTIFKTVACLSFLLSFAACQEFKIDTQMTPEKEAASVRLVSDALESYTISATNPQPISFKVASNTPWTIARSDNAEWLAVSPASSAVSSLNQDITVTAVENTTYEDRSVTLTISAENVETTYSVTITQHKLGKLYVQPVADNFAAGGSTLPFTIETNVAWEARSNEQWLTLSETSGVGDGSVMTIQATADENTSIVRKATVTVVAGEDTETFEVTQKGMSLEIVPLESPVVDRKGGELIFDVDATIEWKVESSNEWFTAEPTTDGKIKVTAPWNNAFAPKTATITLLPTSNKYGDIKSEVEVSQPINFKFEGNYEVLEDGSIKISSGAKSKVRTIDNYRYVSLKLTMGDVNFGDKGELWCATGTTSATGTETCNIYNQISLGGNIRIRQDGTLPNKGKSTYNNVYYSISKAELNAMTEYRFEVLPNLVLDEGYSDMWLHEINFWYNGEKRASMMGRSIFADAADAGSYYWFGFYNTTSDGTWYIVKTCDVTPYADPE